MKRPDDINWGDRKKPEKKEPQRKLRAKSELGHQRLLLYIPAALQGYRPSILAIMKDDKNVETKKTLRAALNKIKEFDNEDMYGRDAQRERNELIRDVINIVDSADTKTYTIFRR